MSPREIAQIYVDLVRLEESLGPDQYQAREEVTLLRSKYHDLLADIFRQAGISCADRFEATRKAFELVSESSPHA
jgi:hypothetical protein